MMVYMYQIYILYSSLLYIVGFSQVNLMRYWGLQILRDPSYAIKIENTPSKNRCIQHSLHIYIKHTNTTHHQKKKKKSHTHTNTCKSYIPIIVNPQDEVLVNSKLTPIIVLQDGRRYNNSFTDLIK